MPGQMPDRGADLGASEHHAGANLHGGQRCRGERQAEIAAGDQVVGDALDAAAQHRAVDERAEEVDDDDGDDHRAEDTPRWRPEGDASSRLAS